MPFGLRCGILQISSAIAARLPMRMMKLFAPRNSSQKRALITLKICCAIKGAKRRLFRCAKMARASLGLMMICAAKSLGYNRPCAPWVSAKVTAWQDLCQTHPKLLPLCWQRPHLAPFGQAVLLTLALPPRWTGYRR